MQKEPKLFEVKIHACTSNRYCIVVEGLPCNQKARHLTNYQDIEELFEYLKNAEKYNLA